jgi:hypothetical protein
LADSRRSQRSRRRTSPRLIAAGRRAATRSRSGTTLSCTKGTWSNADDVQTAYQWERDEETIEGATGDDYTSGDDDEDCALRCWVRVKNAAGAARAVSNEVTIVAAALPEQHGAQKKRRSKAPPLHHRR